MRVTNNMMARQMLSNFNKGLERLARLNDQLSSGKTITRPSHNPAGAPQIMRLKTGLMEIEQYRRNADEMVSWLETTDSALNAVGEALHRARELVIRGASSGLPEESYQALADEMGQLLEGIVDIANSSHGARYIFAGQKTTAPPFAFDADGKVVYQGDQGPLQAELGVGITMTYNVLGDAVFEKIFEAVEKARDALEAGDSNALGNDVLKELTQALDDTLRWRSEVGSKVNRLQMTGERITDAQLNLTKLLSDVEDIDVAKVIMELKMEENAYQAALASGARILQPTLLDYLR
ncbi:MAG: flagellar hook-associated protein FlgL [Limnochordia bacterium]